MIFSEFKQLIEAQPDGVVLLEGRRAIPEEDATRATRLAAMLAEMFPRLRFRSGNAEGSDKAFSDGVARVDPERLQIVAPYSGHRKKFRYDGAQYDSPESLSVVMEEQVAYNH